jgi:hypothetical protein
MGYLKKYETASGVQIGYERIARVYSVFFNPDEAHGEVEIYGYLSKELKDAGKENIDTTPVVLRMTKEQRDAILKVLYEAMRDTEYYEKGIDDE